MAFHGVIPVCSNECEDMVVSNVRRAIGYPVDRRKISSVLFTSAAQSILICLFSINLHLFQLFRNESCKSHSCAT